MNDPAGHRLIGAYEVCEHIRDRYGRIRAHSVNLAKPLSEEDCCVQSMPDASPVKWHLAHTTWFFETFLLEKYLPDFVPFMPVFRTMFNSYYNGVGEKHPRAHRGMLTRPPLHEILLYRKKVNEHMQELFERHGDDAGFCALVDLGLNHEQQHQELLLTDVKHLLSLNPLRPAYFEQEDPDASATPALEWLAFDGGVVNIGHDGNRFHFDNERPAHRQYLNPFLLGSRLVTNGEFLEFIDSGGYRDPRLWLSDGWDWLRTNDIAHPIYWEHEDECWHEFTLGGQRPIVLAAPVSHLSYYEADAFARWAGARLPSEAEWEHAARLAHIADDDRDPANLRPQPASQVSGLQQMFGEAWQWTQSGYTPYPGYAWPEGAIGEYNGKFMVNQYVLRGSSCLTPAGHSRMTYRNFFPAAARWQMTGLRLAKDGAAAI
jgi:ergothioneine biosynthesis protein EgtB